MYILLLLTPRTLTTYFDRSMSWLEFLVKCFWLLFFSPIHFSLSLSIREYKTINLTRTDVEANVVKKLRWFQKLRNHVKWKILKKWNDEVKNFIKVWVSVIISVFYCFYLSPKIKAGWCFSITLSSSRMCYVPCSSSVIFCS